VIVGEELSHGFDTVSLRLIVGWVKERCWIVERLDDGTLDAVGDILSDLSSDASAFLLACASRDNQVQAIGTFHIFAFLGESGGDK
jgi:hypothetical protein